MNIKYKLNLNYRWMILTDDGLLKTPKDSWGYSHSLATTYESKEDAISAYNQFVEEDRECPYSMILLEEYRNEIDWD